MSFEDVGIACALLAPFGFVNANNHYLKKAIATIEERYSAEKLYRRHLLELDAAKEGYSWQSVVGWPIFMPLPEIQQKRKLY